MTTRPLTVPKGSDHFPCVSLPFLAVLQESGPLGPYTFRCGPADVATWVERLTDAAVQPPDLAAEAAAAQAAAAAAAAAAEAAEADAAEAGGATPSGGGDGPPDGPEAAPAASKGLVVLGSSIGWFSFFANLLYGVPSVGYDLLCSDVREAQKVAARHGLDDTSAAAGVRFVCDDARNADLHEAAVIWINGAVWSPVTRSAIYAKLAAEAKPGALVIDYHDALAKAVDDSPFELLTPLVVPTSWSNQTLIFVMQRKGDG
eukprot:SAG22_NODE_863_length_6804_cov_3.086652_8_plen_259_part_00